MRLHALLFATFTTSALSLSAAQAAPPARAPAKDQAAAERPAPAPDNPALAKMKTLLGDWKSSAGGMTMSASYKATGGGKCVAETLTPAPGKEMLTIYCADGPGMVVTHYCDGGTQPRMRAAGLSPDGKTLDFKFTDITNLPSPDAPHMRSVKVTFKDDGHFQQEWTSKQGAKEEPMILAWTKAK